MEVLANYTRNSRGKLDLSAMNSVAVLAQAQGVFPAPQLSVFAPA